MNLIPANSSNPIIVKTYQDIQSSFYCDGRRALISCIRRYSNELRQEHPGIPFGNIVANVSNLIEALNLLIDLTTQKTNGSGNEIGKVSIVVNTDKDE